MTMDSTSHTAIDVTLPTIATAALTRTIVQGSVVRWIFHAKLRDGCWKDLVFIGEDFVEIKELLDNGHLNLIARKADFDARILAASKVTLDQTKPHDDQLKSEFREPPREHDDMVFQESIVLTLDSHRLIFVALSQGPNGLTFSTNQITLPIFDNGLLQPGQFLAVDPTSRALAVAAYEREVVIYATSHNVQSHGYAQLQPPNKTHICQQRSLQIEGVIQLMDFLSPPDSDDDHVVLLLIVVHQRKVKAIHVEWYDKPDTGLQEAHIHLAIPLASAITVPTLLLPMRNAAFMLATGTDIHCYKDILSGSIAQFAIDTTSTSSSPRSGAPFPGVSPRYPVWSTWCRSKKTGSSLADCFFLVREDGALTYLQIFEDEKQASFNMGDLGCFVGNAFVVMETFGDVDVLVAAGDTSSGCIAYYEFAREQLFNDIYDDVSPAFETDFVARIPNWASVTDMVVSSRPPGRTKRIRDSVFVTSGRQPFGTITEMRHGIEACLNLYFELLDLQSVTDIWALPLTENFSALIILSSPDATRLLNLSPTAESDVVEEVEPSSMALDASCRTLTAAFLPNDIILQVTEKSICIYERNATDISNSKNLSLENDTNIISACISTADRLVATVRRTEGSTPSYDLSLYTLDGGCAEGGQSAVQLFKVSKCDLATEPTSIAVVHATSIWLLVCTVQGTVQVFGIHNNSLSLVHTVTLPTSNDESVKCDGIVVMKSPSLDSEFLAVCALRDGTLYTLLFSYDGENNKISLTSEKAIPFGQNTVRLKQPLEGEPMMFAMSGHDFGLLSWSGSSSDPLRVQSIYVTDKERPYLAHSAVTACTKLYTPKSTPPSELTNSVLMVSGSEFLITELRLMPTAIPRQISVTGSPNRLIYAEQQRCLVCASLRCDVRLFPTTHGKPEERRQICPVINFVPYRAAEPSFTFEMQPNERVYALLEWSLRVDENKMYSFILVGGSYLKSDGREKGRIAFLQPLRKNWGVYHVNEGRKSNFDSPIYALALWDDVTYVACSGRSVHIYRFSPEELKWHQLCEPLVISSIGIHITINHPRIYISTVQDSAVVLVLHQHDKAGSDVQFELRMESLPPRADALLNHVVPEQSNLHDGWDSQCSLTLATTKYGQILGLRNEYQDASKLHPGQSRIVFETQLPHSLTRIRQCNIRPRWKSPFPDGVVTGDLIGSTTDGSLIGVAVLSEGFYRRLCWLQRLCEWSQDLCPHLCGDPPYSVSDTLRLREEQVMPIGLCEGSKDDVLLATNRKALQARHIDGDILARIRSPGGIEALESTLRKLAVKNDPVGLWLRQRLEDEVAAIQVLARLLEPLLECWI